MLITGREKFDDKYFIKMDPLDTRRYLTQTEQLMGVEKFGIFGYHNVARGASPEKIQDAMDKFLEWYPMAKLDSENTKSGVHRFREGKVKPNKIVEDVKNNRVIRSMSDFYNAIEEEHFDHSYRSDAVFGAKLMKVDLPPSEDNNVLGTKDGYLLITTTEHLTIDGKSHPIIRNFVNGYHQDKNYKPGLERPQIMPDTATAMIQDDSRPKQIPTIAFGNCDHIGFEKNSKLDPRERGISVDIRKVPRTAFARSKKFSLTVTMAGVQAFIYDNMLLDYHEGKQTVGAAFFSPYKATDKQFKHLIKGNPRDIIGNNAYAAKSYFDLDRENPRTLYQFLEMGTRDHKIARENEYQFHVNRRYSPYFLHGMKFGAESATCLMSNFGTPEMIKGVIDNSFSVAATDYTIGVFNTSVVGQHDGLMGLITVAQKSSFSPRACTVFADLFLRVCQMSAKGDVTRADLVALPEYQELMKITKELN